jgi:hypothetical protein
MEPTYVYGELFSACLGWLRRGSRNGFRVHGNASEPPDNVTGQCCLTSIGGEAHAHKIREARTGSEVCTDVPRSDTDIIGMERADLQSSQASKSPVFSCEHSVFSGESSTCRCTHEK